MLLARRRFDGRSVPRRRARSRRLPRHARRLDTAPHPHRRIALHATQVPGPHPLPELGRRLPDARPRGKDRLRRQGEEPPHPPAQLLPLEEPRSQGPQDHRPGEVDRLGSFAGRVPRPAPRARAHPPLAPLVERPRATAPSPARVPGRRRPSRLPDPHAPTSRRTSRRFRPGSAQPPDARSRSLAQRSPQAPRLPSRDMDLLPQAGPVRVADGRRLSARRARHLPRPVSARCVAEGIRQATRKSSPAASSTVATCRSSPISKRA